jgi:thymidylate kinase
MNNVAGYVSLASLDRKAMNTIISKIQEIYRKCIYVDDIDSSPNAKIHMPILSPHKVKDEKEETLKMNTRQLRLYTTSREIYYYNMMASRHALFKDIFFEEMYKSSDVVFSKGGHLCTLAYQCFGQGMRDHVSDWLINYRKLFIDNKVDDFHIYIRISPKEAMRRKYPNTHEDDLSDKEMQFFEKVDSGYMFGVGSINEKDINRGERAVVINGEDPEDIVFKNVLKAINRHRTLGPEHT